MDDRTRNEFEHYCALAEIEHDPEKFLEIKRSIIRLLDEKESHLNRERHVHVAAAGWTMWGSVGRPPSRASSASRSGDSTTFLAK